MYLGQPWMRAEDLLQPIDHWTHATRGRHTDDHRTAWRIEVKVGHGDVERNEARRILTSIDAHLHQDDGVFVEVEGRSFVDLVEDLDLDAAFKVFERHDGPAIALAIDLGLDSGDQTSDGNDVAVA